MSQSRQTPRNGLAKLLWEADADTPPDEIAAKKQSFECPECGWEANLCRAACMVCEYDEQLDPMGENR